MGKSEGSSVSRSRGSRVFLTRVTRPLSGFQIRNTLGAEGFPIFPSFIGLREWLPVTIEYGTKQKNSDVIRPRRRQVYVLQKLFNDDASSIFENQADVFEKLRIKSEIVPSRLICIFFFFNCRLSAFLISECLSFLPRNMTARSFYFYRAWNDNW